MNNNNHQSQPATAAVDSIHWDVEEGASRSITSFLFTQLCLTVSSKHLIACHRSSSLVLLRGQPIH